MNRIWGTKVVCGAQGCGAVGSHFIKQHHFKALTTLKK
jgi:hypothetical protein